MTVATLGLALGACVGVAVPPLPSGELPAAWRNGTALGAKPDLTGWWRHFHDARLDRLVTTALADNPDVEQAVWNLRAARALEEGAASEGRPAVAFRTDSQSNAANTASYFQAGFDATWEIGLFGRAGAGRHIAAAKTGAAAADLQSARVSLVAEVVREYLQLRAAQQQEAVLARAAHAAQQKLALIRGQARLQLASAIEVEAATTAAQEAEGRVADPRLAIAKSAQALALLLGRSEPDSAWLVRAPLPQLADGNVASVPADLLRTRPEIRYAEAQVVKAAGELGIAKANLYPSLSLGGGLTFATRVQGNGRPGEGRVNGIFGIGPFINIPLFDWDRLRAQRTAQADLLQAALAGYRKAVLAGAAQVETGLAGLHVAGQRLAHADAALASSRRGVALTTRQQAGGEADQLDVIAAKLAFDQVALAQGQAQLQQGLAFVALYKALGGAPLPKDDAATSDRSSALPSGEDARSAGEGTLQSTVQQREPEPPPLSGGERGSTGAQP